jgi:hypothetical protein
MAVVLGAVGGAGVSLVLLAVFAPKLFDYLARKSGS